jgi:hypothetical protein
VLSGRESLSGLVGRQEGRQKVDAIQAQLGASSARQLEMSIVRGIEAAAQDAQA